MGIKTNRLITAVIVVFSIFLESCGNSHVYKFEGLNALQLIEKQIELGPRIPGSDASYELSTLVRNELKKTKWIVEYQDFQFNGINLRNIIIKTPDNPIKILLGTHYDTRKYSDEEIIKEKRLRPVPGANDGGSGTALLIELAKTLDPKNYPGLGFVLFDAEDQGKIDGWDWSIGADYYVKNLETFPDQVIILDMVGDKDLNIHKEINSDPLIINTIWDSADNLEFGYIFVNEYKYSMMDDHIPFIKNEIPAALLIDFDYPYWHTNEDTIDKVSAKSLEIVASVIQEWLDNYALSSK